MAIIKRGFYFCLLYKSDHFKVLKDFLGNRVLGSELLKRKDDTIKSNSNESCYQGCHPRNC